MSTTLIILIIKLNNRQEWKSLFVREKNKKEVAEKNVTVFRLITFLIDENTKEEKKTH